MIADFAMKREVPTVVLVGQAEATKEHGQRVDNEVARAKARLLELQARLEKEGALPPSMEQEQKQLLSSKV